LKPLLVLYIISIPIILYLFIVGANYLSRPAEFIVYLIYLIVLTVIVRLVIVNPIFKRIK